MIDDINKRLRMTEDGTLIDNDDMRWLMGIVRAVEAYAVAKHRFETSMIGVAPWYPRRDACLHVVRAIEDAIARNDMHQLDLLLNPPHQEP